MALVNTDILIVIVVVVAVFGAMRWTEKKWGHRFSESEYESKMTELEKRYEEKVADLEKRVRWLLDELEQAKARIRELEKTQTSAASHRNDMIPAKPLLFICGPDMSLCEIDRQALRRVGVSFQRLHMATRQAVENELRRRRQDNTLYPWLHVTAHASEDGILLTDGIASPAFWNDMLPGVQVVFLAACQTASVADALAGMVTVIYVLEDIDNRDASDFTYAFWRRMREHGDPQRAYRQAVVEAPQIAEFTDIRRS